MVKGKGLARQQILDVAGPLFFREGFRAVGVDTIVEQAGIAKMTLYRHFPSKDDLIVAYLEQSNNKFWNWFEAAIDKQAGGPRQQLTALFKALETMVTNSGCYGCSFQVAAAEFPELNQAVHQVALAHKQTLRQRLFDLATQAGAHKPDVLADQLLLMMDGAFVAARIFGPTNPALHVAEAAATLINAQFPATA